MAADGLQLLIQLLGGSGANLRDVSLGFMLPQLPKIAKQLTTAGIPPAPTGAQGAAAGGGPETGAPGILGGIPPQLAPLIALAARQAQGGAGQPMPAAPAPRPLPRLATMDTGV
jgi:hypothetical protein